LQLYHFTWEGVLPAILRDGINRGDIPLTPAWPPPPDEQLSAPWLTTDNRPDGHGLEGVYPGFPDKKQVRITVDRAKLDIERLFRWSAFADDLNIDREWRRVLERGRKPNSWLIYFGIVRPETFVTVDVRNKHGYYRPLWDNLGVISPEVRELLLPTSAAFA
jgi:hypothetical protein